MKQNPIVSSLAMSFRKAATIIEDAAEAKKEHRKQIKTLIDKYFDDVQSDKASGIRTAKELVEVIKLDLLLLGEATDRNETTTAVEEARILKVAQSLDINNPDVQNMISSLFGAFNDANDEADDSPDIRTGDLEQDVDDTEDTE